jgi:opacity protein-like surface antigen
MRFFPAVAVSLVLAGQAAAQAPAHQFQITPSGGYTHFDRASGLANSARLGLDLGYGLSRYFALGTSFSISQPQTRGEDFIASLTYGDPTAGDTTFFFRVTQPISVTTAEFAGTVRAPMAGRITPFATAGVGVYTLYMDPQVVAGRRTYSRLSSTIGAGFNFRVGNSSGITFDVRDMILTKYNRDRLNATDRRFSGGRRFAEDFPPPIAPKATLHNIAFNIGFSFIPRGSGVTDDDTPSDTTRSQP